MVGRPWSLPGQPRRPERDDGGGSCSKRGGARGGERRGRAGASLPRLRGASPPAEPSPILMTGERARGQEIGAGSCGSGDSAASRRAGGGRPAAGSSPKGRGCSFDPKTALLGSRCREPRRRGGRGAQALGTAGCSAAPPFNNNNKKKVGGRKPGPQLQAGWAWEAAQAGRRTKRLTRCLPRRHRKRTARPGHPAPGLPAAPAPDPLGGRRAGLGTRKVNH